MRHCVPILLVVSLAVVLQGCALSSFTIASMALNGLSYAVSGKSVPDHALSSAMRGDCALVRVISGDRVCLVGSEVEGLDGDITPRPTVVAASGVLSGPAPAASATQGTRAEENGLRDRAVTEASRTPALESPPLGGADGASGPAASDVLQPAAGEQAGLRLASSEPSLEAWTDEQPQLFVVVGSFQDKANAERRRAAHAESRLAPATIDGVRHFRVVLGPFGDSITKLATDAGSALRAGAGRWPVWLCPGSLSAPPCSVTIAQAGSD